MTIKPS